MTVLWAADAALASSAPAHCQAPSWLCVSMGKSLDAVWDELERGEFSHRVAVNTLARVAERLFPGFLVTLSDGKLELKPQEQWNWTVSIAMLPSNDGQDFAAPLRDWMVQDLQDAKAELEQILQNVPPEALGWASDAFKAEFDQILMRSAAGWHGNAIVRGHEKNQSSLEVQLYPRQPLVLAISPSAISSSLPQLAMQQLNDQILSQLSPLIGLPVAWVVRHQEQIAQWVNSEQSERGILKQLQGKVRTEIASRPIVRVDASVESRTYSFRGWLSIHAGSGDAQPEAGLHLGRIFPLGEKVLGEFYAEGRSYLSDWELEGRLGFRFSPLRDLWLGIERSVGADENWWYHLWLGGARIGPYGWGRYSENDDFEGAIGYRLNRTFSLELFYDNRRDDQLSLRAVSDL